MAVCGLGESPWIPVKGGPRQVQINEEPPA